MANAGRVGISLGGFAAKKMTEKLSLSVAAISQPIRQAKRYFRNKRSINSPTRNYGLPGNIQGL